MPDRDHRREQGIWQHPSFRTGIVDVIPVGLGLAAWGVMTGVAIVKSGMGAIEVLLMSVIVFAGSSQLASLPLIAAGAPIAVVLATAFCVNLRFVVFSIHLRPYVMHQPRWRRVLSGYLMADVSYVLFTRRHPKPPTDPADIASSDAYWAGSGCAAYAAWTGSTLVGVALGNNVPVAWGLGFAGILALIGVTSTLVSTPLRALSAIVAGAAAIVAIGLPLRLNILVAIAVAVVVCIALERTSRTST